MQNSSRETQLNSQALERLFYHLNSPFYMPWSNRKERNLKPLLVQQPARRNEQRLPDANFFAPRIG